jgi:hypothetical protein
MANKAIHQLPSAGPREDGDVLYIVRAGGDFQLPASGMAPAILQESTVLSSAQVLALFTTPVQVVSAAPAGMVNVPVGCIIQFSGGTTNYAGSTAIFLGGTSTLSSVNYALGGDISDRSAPYAMGVSTSSRINTGDPLSVMVPTSNPTTGDSTLTLTTYFYQRTP